MSLLERATESLKNSLFKKNKPANYKLLSRSLDIRAADAKKLLYTFYNAHREQLQATYVIIGQPRDSVQQIVVKVTNDLEEKSQFEKVESVQVYSLSAKEISVDEVAQMMVSDVGEIQVTEEKMEKWGLIKGPEFVQVEKTETVKSTDPTRPSTSSASGAKEEKKQGAQGGIFASMNKAKAKKEEEKNESFPDMTSQASRILAKYKKEEPKKKDTQQTFGRSVTSGATTKGSTPNAKEDTRRTKTEPVPEVEVIDDPELNDEEYVKKQRKEKQEKDRRQKELESMFDDDDDHDITEIDDPAKEQDAAVKEQKEVKKEEPQSKNADLEGIFDSSFSQSQSQSQAEKPLEKSTEKTKSSSKATEKEETTTYVDEDGFIVTKVEKSKPKPKPAKSNARPASSTTTPATKKQKTGTKQQSSLASFFGKKK